MPNLNDYFTVVVSGDLTELDRPPVKPLVRNACGLARSNVEPNEPAMRKAREVEMMAIHGVSGPGNINALVTVVENQGLTVEFQGTGPEFWDWMHESEARRIEWDGAPPIPEPTWVQRAAAAPPRWLWWVAGLGVAGATAGAIWALF